MEGSGLHKKQLREVKEEPIERGSDEIESDYFRKLHVIFQDDRMNLRLIFDAPSRTL